jgi:hypothetical protein
MYAEFFSVRVQIEIVSADGSPVLQAIATKVLLVKNFIIFEKIDWSWP